MTSSGRLRLLADYLAATRNEIAVDEMFLNLAHLTPAQVGYLPRVPHWLSIAMRAPILTRTFWYLARILWLAGGALIFFAIELLKFDRWRSRLSHTLAQPISLTEGAVLGFSSRIGDIVDNERFPWLPSIWLTCPWTGKHTIPQNAVELSLMTIITRNDLLKAFACALWATYALAKNPICTDWVLQSYTAFRWFMVRTVVDQIAGTLVTTEHFDRWAVLADRSIRAQHHRYGDARRLVLVQHGALAGLSSNDHSHNVLKQLPTQLSCIDELHTYNSTEENIFRNAVLAKNHRRTPLRVHYFSPTIFLFGKNSTDLPRLLFVGHPLCEEFQSKVYTELCKSIPIKAFYKPHPMAPMSKSMATIGWTIVEDSKTFPYVEMLISYPSTLVIEYEGSGIPAVVHPIDIDIDAFQNFTAQALEKLNSLCATE